MNDEAWLDDRGWYASFVAPPTTADEAWLCRDHVLDALDMLSPAIHPTAVEIEYGYFDEVLGLRSRLESEAPVIVLAEVDAPVFPTVAAAEVCRHRALTSDLLRRVLDEEARRPAPPGHVSDLARIEIISSALCREERTSLSLRELPSHPIVPFVRNARAWYSGPVDVPGYRNTPPARVRITHDGGVLQLEISVHWAPWSRAGSPENEALGAVVSSLSLAGFVAEPCSR